MNSTLGFWGLVSADGCLRLLLEINDLSLSFYAFRS